MELLKRTLAEEYKKRVRKKGLTQQELADQSNFSLKHVQSCERGGKESFF